MLPPERAFGGNLDGIGRHLEPGDAEGLEVRLPGRPGDELLGRVRGKLAHHWSGEVVVTHVSERGFVDDVVVVTGAQDLQEVPPALGEAGGKEGKVSVPDLGRDAVLGAMARPYRRP